MLCLLYKNKQHFQLMTVLMTENPNLRQRKHTIRGDHVDAPIENDSTAKLGYLSVSGLPFILHLGFMAATAFFVMHVQVDLFIL